MIRLILLSTLLLTPAALQARTESTCDRVFSTPFEPGKVLVMDLRPGDIEVFGTAESEIRIACRLDHPEASPDIRIVYDPDSRGGRLRISRGPHNGVHFRIYIPRKTNLEVDCTAGNLTIDGVEGDKVVDLNAGNLRIRGVNPASYSRLDASVTAGNVRARGVDRERSGLFRSVRHSSSSGHYRLKARVMAGNIEIE